MFVLRILLLYRESKLTLCIYVCMCRYIYTHYKLYIILQVTWQLAVGIPHFVPLPAEPWQEWVFPSEFAGGLLLLPFFLGRCTIPPHPQCDLHGTHVFLSAKIHQNSHYPANPWNLKYYLDGLKRLHPTYLQVWYFSRGILDLVLRGYPNFRKQPLREPNENMSHEIQPDQEVWTQLCDTATTVSHCKNTTTHWCLLQKFEFWAQVDGL